MVETIATIVASVVGLAIIAVFCYGVYRRVIKGESADFQKRDEKGKIVK